MHKMAFNDIKSLISYLSAVFIPFCRGVYCAAWHEGNWHSDLAKPGLKPMLHIISLKLVIFQILDCILCVSIWGRDEFDIHRAIKVSEDILLCTEIINAVSALELC